MNASNPMTPGVYTVEKSAFPPAAGQVPTAIPAFVGYTEKATKDGKSLQNVPLLINSISDFNLYFVGAPEYEFPINIVPKPAGGGVPKASDYDFTVGAGYYKIGNAKKDFFYMYNCLRFFYLNGGGPCYIISVGTYLKPTVDAKGNITDEPSPADRDELLGGLEQLKFIQFPKPTLILIPDSLTLSSADHTTVQQEMIAQAGELMDRVAMLEVYNGDQGLDTSVIGDFRNGVGVTFLSYATSYYPWLQTSVVEASEIDFANLYTPTAAEASTIENIKDLIKGNPYIPILESLTEDYNTLEDNLMVAAGVTLTGQSAIDFPDWTSAFNASPATTTAGLLQDQGTVLADMYQELFDMGNSGKTANNPLLVISNADLIKGIGLLTNANGSLASAMLTLAGFESALKIGTAINSKLKGWNITNPVPDPYAGITPTPTLDTQANTVMPLYKNALASLLKALNSAISTANTLLMQYNTALSNSNADYANVMAAVAKKVNVLPPASAMAGIYTLTDNTFGVWRAPANINIDAVTAPMVSINDDQQASLNVDALAGKSINAIRSFYGRGPAIVWGARTLDGNSLDYRYVPIRRTLIMIEQSVANAAFSMVFAPNDSTTWSSIQGMISNFLNTIWQAGGLQGSSAKDAYNVEVGLGKTMTSLDILNGIMRVSVKVALVHPAEFIIITYEQEMAKS